MPSVYRQKLPRWKNPDLAVSADVEIRIRGNNDLDACVAVLAEVHEVNEYPSMWPADPRAWLSPDGMLDAWIAYVDDVLVGHIARVGTAKKAEVVRLFVAPSARRTGVAAALLDTVLRAAHRVGGELWLETAEEASAAVTFYQRQGWRLTEREPAGWLDRYGKHPMLVRFAEPTPADLKG